MPQKPKTESRKRYPEHTRLRVVLVFALAIALRVFAPSREKKENGARSREEREHNMLAAAGIAFDAAKIAAAFSVTPLAHS